MSSIGAQTAIDICRALFRRSRHQAGKTKSHCLLTKRWCFKALILAEHESPYTEVYESTRGLIFFGTPHQGSNIATYTATLVSIANAVTAKPPADLLQSLRRNSGLLIKLNKDFLLREQARHYGVVSFYETKPMVLWNVVCLVCRSLTWRQCWIIAGCRKEISHLEVASKNLVLPRPLANQCNT
jgi:hypothetical protein